MKIEMVKIKDVVPYENNPRKNDEAVEYVANSIKEFGFKVPIVIDKDNVIVTGHTRWKAASALGLKEVPCIRADDLTEDQIKAFRVADNKVGEFAEWDDEKLLFELDSIEMDMSEFGFDDIDVEEDLAANLEQNRSSLFDKYVIPPFSVLDTRQGYWQDRKKIWKSFIKSDEGRSQGLLGEGLKQLAQKYYSGSALTGTSIFDPVLTEILLRWFCPANGRVIDCFAGGSVRGLVSTMLGNDYTGVDLSTKQIEANKNNYEQLKGQKDLF